MMSVRWFTDKLSPRKTLQRFLVPQFVVSLVYACKYRCWISTKAEVELSPHLRLGRGAVISSFVKVKATDGPLSIGRETGIASFSFLSSSTAGIAIGDYCLIGPGVVITNSTYKYDRLDMPFCQQGQTSQGVRIGDNVWIGGNTTIVDGTHLGDNTIVAANSLLNRRYPPNAILQGNPAKVLLKRS